MDRDCVCDLVLPKLEVGGARFTTPTGKFDVTGTDIDIDICED